MASSSSPKPQVYDSNEDDEEGMREMNDWLILMGASSSSPKPQVYDSNEDDEEGMREMNDWLISMASSSPQPQVVSSKSSCGYDSNEDDEEGMRDMNEEEENLYYQALEESEGFDVPYFHESAGTVPIVQMIRYPQYPLPKSVAKCAKEAIQHYNNENGTNFEMVYIVKVNCESCCGVIYYITFEVKELGTPPDSPTTIFQAKVLAGLFDHIEVQLCRPKPTL